MTWVDILQILIYLGFILSIYTQPLPKAQQNSALYPNDWDRGLVDLWRD